MVVLKHCRSLNSTLFCIVTTLCTFVTQVQVHRQQEQYWTGVQKKCRGGPPTCLLVFRKLNLCCYVTHRIHGNPASTSSSEICQQNGIFTNTPHCCPSQLDQQSRYSTTYWLIYRYTSAIMRGNNSASTEKTNKKKQKVPNQEAVSYANIIILA